MWVVKADNLQYTYYFRFMALWRMRVLDHKGKRPTMEWIDWV